MTTLERITIRGFRSIRSIEDLELGDVNVLIGPNGSGKSNFIGAMTFLRQIQDGNLQSYVRRAGGAENLLHFGSGFTEEISIHISFTDLVNQYEINLEPTETDSLYPYSEFVYSWDRKAYPDRPCEERLFSHGNEAAISERDLTGVASRVRHQLRSWRLYHFDNAGQVSPMKRTTPLRNNRHLSARGSNLAAVLYLLEKKYQNSYRMIRDTVRLAAPFFDDFILEPDELNEDTIRLEWRHKGMDDYFDASSLSDGTLRFMALATLLLQPERFRPSVILLDEPELGLHPFAITLLAELVHSVSDKTQVILATQSPILLDHFDTEDVLVAERVDDGTELTRLDPESLEIWLEDYSLGQLWEKNEIGGRP